MKPSNLLHWTILGFLVLVFGGSALHFTYAWSGENVIVGVVSAVNESVWEHLKLGFWALIAVSLFDYWLMHPRSNYWLAKGVGITAMQLFIVAFFYSYTSFTGTEILWLDIASYIVACALCQWIAYQFLQQPQRPNSSTWLGLGLLSLQFILLTVFTFYPPHLELFQDHHSLQYGIDKTPEQHTH